MKQDTSWAYALKPGDKAVIRLHSNPYNAPYEVLTFSRATATLLVFDAGSIREKRVRKSDLRVTGGDSFRRIEPVTQEALDANARYRLLRDLTGLKDEALGHLSTAELRLIRDLVFPPPVAAEAAI